MEFSLSYFSADRVNAGEDKYRLVLEGARFADAHGFRAIWLPERHFQEFGGLYPNPSVLAAAVAASTERVRIRAGSVVMPLHHPLRVCEEWAFVDNLSDGRVDISFASGWHPADFVLSTERYDDRKRIMFEGIEMVRRLWRGETVNFLGPDAVHVAARIYPKPVQTTLSVWVTSSGSPQTWQSAGQIGAGVLAALIAESMAGLRSKINLYREALAANGHDPAQGHVTVMLHTFLGDNSDVIKVKARQPLQSYVRAFMRQEEDRNLAGDTAAKGKLARLSEGEKDELVAYAYERYFQGNALLGTVDKCIKVVDQLRDIGVDEIACLIDFGMPLPEVLESLNYLEQLKANYRLDA